MTPPRSVEKWVEDFSKRIGQSVLNPGLEKLTETEQAGEMGTMTGGVWFPRRWLIELLLAYAAEQVADTRHDLFQMLVNRLSCDLAGLEDVPSDTSFMAMFDQLEFHAREAERHAIAKHLCMGCHLDLPVANANGPGPRVHVSSHGGFHSWLPCSATAILQKES